LVPQSFQGHAVQCHEKERSRKRTPVDDALGPGDGAANDQRF